MKILLSNDDGVTAPGLHQMADALKRLGDVFICAPEGPRSGASSSLTLYSPLLVTQLAPRCWSVSGNPADAVKLALTELVGPRPDIVVSGINNGLNCGSNVLYSGTVAAALEGAQAGIPSFAVSRRVAGNENYKTEAKAAARIIEKLAEGPSGDNTVYNINFPAGRTRGVVTTTTELMPYTDRYDRRVDPRGRIYYWLRGEPPRDTRGNGHLTDEAAVARGYVAVTPLRRNLTDDGLLERLARIYPVRK
ncbi:MAG: 5'/3'-nucleotidase SurE [Planctomycetes bacterium]|nr:5'/3'-nucleotidase SurE [Candidatus Rokubacteria bacterium]MBI3854999.1 5'/3'-nucleotidase SurE [Planctomycetota bacterium]